jgi:hypothetical protein
MLLIAVLLVADFSGSIVADSVSKILAIPMQETQQIISEEQERERVQASSSSVGLSKTADGKTGVSVLGSISLNFETKVSGEILKTYFKELVDLVMLKEIWDFVRDCFNMLFEIKVAFLLCIFMVEETKRRTIWQTAL